MQPEDGMSGCDSLLKVLSGYRGVIINVQIVNGNTVHRWLTIVNYFSVKINYLCHLPAPHTPFIPRSFSSKNHLAPVVDREIMDSG